MYSTWFNKPPETVFVIGGNPFKQYETKRTIVAKKLLELTKKVIIFNKKSPAVGILNTLGKQ